MEKKFPIFKILTLLVWLVLGMGTAFALDCATGTGWGDYLTKSVTKTGDYYEISSPEELAWISCKMKHDNNNFKAAKIKLTKSIDMQGSLGKAFIPIAAGTGTPPLFAGIFDGQGFTISDLYINGSEINNDDVSTYTGKSKNGATAYAQNIGLFGILSGGTIKNLTLKDAQIYAASSAGSTGINSDKPISVGTLVGWVNDASTIENCVASGSIETSGATNRVGGIVGNVKNITITNCVSSVSVTASGESTNVGGIVGALRNGGKVNMSSCVYSGNSLYTVDGSVGAIAGSYESVGSISTVDLYYSDDYCGNLVEGETCPGIGSKPDNATFNTTPTDSLNSEKVVCDLNGGTWKNESCTEAKTNAWSVGQSDVSMNGSDGYKITFNANGGTFASGAKTSKILAKNAIITADEIGVPTREGKKFGGWATTANAADTASDLGVAHAATTIYAVWYDFYEVTFKTGCDTAFSDATFPDGSKTKTISVAKHGVVSVNGFSVPTTYESDDNGKKVTYYFTGWAYEPKEFNENTDTLHLSAIDVTAPVTLYAVWTKAPIFSVTFEASLHGNTAVHFVKMVAGGTIVSRPDTVITDAGYKVVGWCISEDCTEQNEYTFTQSLTENLVLHARWDLESYSINYVLDGGTNAEENPSTYNINSDDIVFAAPTRNDGATFDGWFYDLDFTNPATKIESGSTGNKTVYAKWNVTTYTIQYLSGKAISATVNGDTKNYNKSITLRDAPPEFAVAGCTLDGWSKVDYDQEGYAVDYAFGATYAENANLKLFPHWICNTYDITYEVFGVTPTNRNPKKYTGPAKLTLENAFDPANKYFMDSWYKERDFKNTIRDVQNIDADLTLYAKWYNKIYYKAGSKATGKAFEEKKFFDNTYTIQSATDKFTRANYTIDGWSTTDGGEKVYGLGDAYTTNENLTLYPHWVENRDCAQYGPAITVCTYATDGRKEAIINGDYGDKDKGNEHGLAVEIPNDIPVNSVVMTREFPTGLVEYSTFVLPFDVSSANVSNVRAVLRYNGIKNGSTISMKVVWAADGVIQDAKGNNVHYGDSTLKANTPYLVLMDQNSDGKFVVNGGVTLKKTTVAETTADGWTFRGTWQYKMWGAKGTDPETGNAYGFSASKSTANNIDVGTFVKVGEGAWIRPMRAYLVKEGISQIRANGAYVKRPTVKPEELPEIMSVVIDGIGDGNETTVIGQFNTRTGVFKMNYDRGKFDLKGRRVNGSNNARGAYYGKKILKK